MEDDGVADRAVAAARPVIVTCFPAKCLEVFAAARYVGQIRILFNKGAAVGKTRVTRDGRTGRLVASEERFEAVMQAARQAGLLGGKGGRIGGRVSPVLVRQAKRQTGIETDTDLIEFALATVALEDNFARTFKTSRGKVDPGLKLGF